jgi:hypothetical protein
MSAYEPRPFIQIDKEIPLPPKQLSVKLGRKKRTQAMRYPFGWMVPGDSFFTKNKHIHSAIHHFRIRHPNMKFAIRKQDNGFRVWKIKYR